MRPGSSGLLPSKEKGCREQEIESVRYILLRNSVFIQEQERDTISRDSSATKMNNLQERMIWHILETDYVHES